MIRINLLPPSVRRSTLQLGQLPWKSIGKGAIGLVVGISVLLLASNGLHALVLGRLAGDWKRLQPEWSQMERTQGILRALQNRTALHKTLKAPEAQWAPRLNFLSDALVSQLWFTSLEYKLAPAAAPAKPSAPTKLKSKAKAKSPPPPPPAPTLILKGSAFVTQAGGSPVGRYLQRLKEQPDFKRWFRDVELKSVEQRQVYEEQISDFEMAFSPRGL